MFPSAEAATEVPLYWLFVLLLRHVK